MFHVEHWGRAYQCMTMLPPEILWGAEVVHGVILRRAIRRRQVVSAFARPRAGSVQVLPVTERRLSARSGQSPMPVKRLPRGVSCLTVRTMCGVTRAT
ncbi:MAG: hypothetical protein CWE10_06780 [Symbiobacterium thermophilum]|uniref:Uncharacterized protein n=1 Tax=Symbiobacterium thermophilum TaxID=2734 RepID=A0A953LJJ1_SYMTR|nr:hypothetical protein [Symbiobacterium thermophilum]